MNPHALTVLEFSAALERVAARAGSEPAREALLARRPGVELEPLREELARVAETLRYLERNPTWAPPSAPDVRRPLAVVETEGGVLDPAGMLLVRRLLESSRTLSAALEADAEEAAADADADGPEAPPPSPHLTRLRGRLPVLPELLAELERTVDDDGEVRDGASSALRSLRSSLRSARGKMVLRLERYLDSLPDRYRVPDASVSVRDGRYVIPIRREGKSHVGGVIHGESHTGATLFVEPPAALEAMNELLELEREEEREVQRILRELTARLRARIDALASGFEALVDFDTLWARALTARAWEAEPPELLGPDADEVVIVRGRHPLLLEKGEDPVVPFDFTLEPHERATVISGPNTGGKTVFLKAMGLIPLLAQSGILPPVGTGTRLPIFRDVFADIGDEQSIAESLSTFSAHLSNAIEIVEGAGPGTLVLMDEMGTGTDPSEGAALARAILETIVERGARAVVTSHLGALKRLDRDGSGIVNASLLFDAQRLAPTYRLKKGRPGRSYGLAIARRLGLPDDVLDRAEAHVDSGELEVESLLATLQEKEEELSGAVADAREARDEVERLRAELRERKAELEERERSAEARAREEARQLLMEARDEVERAIEEVRTSDSERRDEAVHRARRRVEEAAKEQLERMPRRERERSSRPEHPLREGDRVKVRGSGAKGVVRELRDDRVTVEVGAMRMQLSPGDVEPVQGGGGEEGEGRSPSRKGEAPGRGGGWTGPSLPESNEADLRGLRVDEVELGLGRALDGAIYGNFAELRIIHGKGTGAVKARVQELLRQDPRVVEFRAGRPGEGGGGVTVVRLR